MAETDQKPIFDHALAIARKVLPFMGDNRIPATPQNYMIFYLYYEGGSEMIKRVVDEQLTSSKPWDDATTERIFQQLFSAEANLNWYRFNERLAEQIKAMSEGLLEETSSTADVANQTSRRINTAIKEAAKLYEIKEVAAWLKEVIGEISQVEDVSRSLGLSLSEKNAEIEDIISTLNEVEFLALTDELTQLANRRAWDARIEEAFNKFIDEGRPSCVIMVDLDDFKKLNDTYGHLVGDRALKEVALALMGRLRGEDLAARYGGEEFACLLADTELDKGVIVAEQLRLRLEMTNFTVRGEPVLITASFGVAKFMPQDASPQAVVGRADQALYLAKSKGKNQVCHQNETNQNGGPVCT